MGTRWDADSLGSHQSTLWRSPALSLHLGPPRAAPWGGCRRLQLLGQPLEPRWSPLCFLPAIAAPRRPLFLTQTSTKHPSPGLTKLSTKPTGPQPASQTLPQPPNPHHPSHRPTYHPTHRPTYHPTHRPTPPSHAAPQGLLRPHAPTDGDGPEQRVPHGEAAVRYLLLLHPPLGPARHGPTRFGPFSPQKAPFPPGTSPPFPEPPGPASSAHPTRPRLSRRHLVSATRPWPWFPSSPAAAGHSSYVGFFCGVTRWGRRPDALSSLSLSISPGAADLPTEMCVFFFLSPPVLLCLRALPRSARCSPCSVPCSTISSDPYDFNSPSSAPQGRLAATHGCC